MKHFLKKIFSAVNITGFVLLLLIEGSILFPSPASAQTPPATPPSTPPGNPSPTATNHSKEDNVNCFAVVAVGTCSRTNSDKSITSCKADINTSSCIVTFPDKTTYTVPGDGVDQFLGTTNTAKDAKGDVSKTDTGGLKGAAVNAIITTLASIMYYMMSAVGYLLGLVGNVFNWVIVITVFQYAIYFGNSAGMLIAWGILRDIANIVLLFGFIFMGVMVILDLHSIDLKKALPRLIIVAVLLNFSLFAAEAVIDVANVLSATLYKQAGTSLDTGNCTTQTQSDAKTCTNTGIAGVILNDTYISGVWTGYKLPEAGTEVNQLLTYIGITFFMLVVLVLFLTAIVMFVTRAVTLTILLVLSPLGIAAMAIDKFADQGKKWQDMLISNAFFAPIFLLLFFVGLKVMDAARQALVAGGGGTTLADALGSPGQSAGGILLIFGLTIGFMIAALTYAKGSSAVGAKFATTFAQNTVQRAVRAPFVGGAAAGAFVGRRTVGRASAALSDKIHNSDFGRTEFGRFAKSITDKGANASFDPRTNKAISGALGSTAGKGGSKGYAGIIKKGVDERAAHGGSLHDTEEEKALIATHKKEKTGMDAKWQADRTKLAAAVEAANTSYYKSAEERLAAIAAAQKELDEAEEKHTTASKEHDAATPLTAQGKYMADLKKGNVFLNATRLNELTLIDQVNEGAIKKMMKESKKTALDKALKTLAAETEKPGGDTGHGDSH